MEKIVEAAIMHDGEVWHLPAPARHGDVCRAIYDATGNPCSGGKAQGFYTSLGRFVDREEAGKIALAAGQTDALNWGPDLYSEDLW